MLQRVPRLQHDVMTAIRWMIDGLTNKHATCSTVGNLSLSAPRSLTAARVRLVTCKDSGSPPMLACVSWHTRFFVCLNTVVNTPTVRSTLAHVERRQ